MTVISETEIIGEGGWGGGAGGGGDLLLIKLTDLIVRCRGSEGVWKNWICGWDIEHFYLL